MTVSAIAACRRATDVEPKKIGDANQLNVAANAAASEETSGFKGRFTWLGDNPIVSQITAGTRFDFFKVPQLPRPFGLPKPDHNDVFRHYQVLACLAP